MVNVVEIHAVCASSELCIIFHKKRNVQHKRKSYISFQKDTFVFDVVAVTKERFILTVTFAMNVEKKQNLNAFIVLNLFIRSPITKHTLNDTYHPMGSSNGN